MANKMSIASGKSRLAFALLVTIIDPLLATAFYLMWVNKSTPLYLKDKTFEDTIMQDGTCMPIYYSILGCSFIRLCVAIFAVFWCCRFRQGWTLGIVATLISLLCLGAAVVCRGDLYDIGVIVPLAWCFVCSWLQSGIWHWHSKGMYSVSLHYVSGHGNFMNMRSWNSSGEVVGMEERDQLLPSVGKKDSAYSSNSWFGKDGSGSMNDVEIRESMGDLDDEEAAISAAAAHAATEAKKKNLRNATIGEDVEDSVVFAQRWLTSLSPGEMVALTEFRRKVKDIRDAQRFPTETDDFALMRYLRACQLDVTAAEAKLRKSLAWRQEKNVDTLTLDAEIKEQLDKKTIIISERRTINGEPIWVIILKRHFPDPALTDKCVRAGIYLMEQTAKLLRHPSDKFCVIADCSEFTLSQVDWPILKEIVHILQDYYPERLRCAILVNDPWYLRGVWNVFRMWLNELTRNRFRLLGGHYHHALQEITGTTSLKELAGDRM